MMIYIWVAVLVIAAVFGVYWFFFRDKTNTLSGLTLRFGKDNSQAYAKEALYYIDGDQLYALDYANNVKWSATLPTTDMSVSASDAMVLAYNATMVLGYTFDGEKMYEQPFYGKVLDAKAGATLTAVLNEDASGLVRVYLLDASGSPINNYTYDNKYILDFGFFGGNRWYIYVMELNSTIPYTQIITFEDLANTGSIAITRQILHKLIFLPDRIWAVGTNELIELDYLGVQYSKHLVYGWSFRSVMQTSNNNQLVLALVPGGESQANTSIYSTRLVRIGEQDIFVQMPANTIDILLAKDRLYAFTAKGMRSYQLNGSRDKEFLFEVEHTEYIGLPDGQHFLGITGQEVRLYTFS